VTVAATITRFNTPWNAAWFTGTSATSGLVPGLYPVALDGRPYLVNLDHAAVQAWGVYFKRESLPMLRAQADTGDTPGEQSLSPQQFWRRSAESWHHGAGQNVYDRKTSDRFRFRDSRGVDVWTPYQLSLLNSTALVRSSVNSDLSLVAAGGYVYVGDGQALAFTATNIAPTWTTVTGTPAATCLGLATSGGTVYANYGASGVYQTAPGAAAATGYITSAVDLVGYSKGRLLAAVANSLYNPTVAGALPAAFFTHPDAAFRWVSFAEGQGFIYAAGGAGNRSRIYRITVQPDGTSLSVPVEAAALPYGETVTAILGYLGFVIIGTTLGVRFAVPASSGDLTLGPLIPTGSPVKCLTAADRFVWFGLTNPDSQLTGLGRLDMSTFTGGQLAPAYAPDVLAAAQGTVTAAVEFAGRRWFAVDTSGVWVEQNTPVPSGWVTSGDVWFGIGDPKTVVFADVNHQPLPPGCSVAVNLTADGGQPMSLGSSRVAGAVAATLDGMKHPGRTFETTLVLNGFGGPGPVVSSWTLRVYPRPQRSSEWVLPLLLYDTLDADGTVVHADPVLEHDFLTNLHGEQRVVTLQNGSRTYQVVLADYLWLPEKRTGDGLGWQGTFVAKLREITG